MGLKPFADSEAARNIRHHWAGQKQNRGVYAKQISLPAGSFIVTHSHLYDHLSILACGRAYLVTNGDGRHIDGPEAVEIEAGIEHTIYAITDIVWFCVHPNDETDPDKIDETLIAKGVP